MNDKGKQFYDYLVSKDIKVPATYEEFQSSMQDSAIASQFHSFVKSKGITVPESVDEFSSVFSIQEAQESVPDVKKKEQTEPTQAVQTQQAAPTQAAPLPGLGGVSEEPTPSPSVGQEPVEKTISGIGLDLSKITPQLIDLEEDEAISILKKNYSSLGFDKSRPIPDIVFSTGS